MIITDPEYREEFNRYIGFDVLKRTRQASDFVVPLKNGNVYMEFHWVDQSLVRLATTDEDLIVAAENPKIIEYSKTAGDAGTGIDELYTFFTLSTADDIIVLQRMEDKIFRLQERLLSAEKTSQADADEIAKYRNKILKSKRYYTMMEFLTDELAAQNKRFRFIDRRFDRLQQIAINNHEYIEEVMDSYQSHIDLEQNNIMRYLTVITSIFMPLQLVTGWYGMNVAMPEFRWRFGYPFVIALSVGLIVVLLWICKMKKWL